jgi:hypothetical protein
MRSFPALSALCLLAIPIIALADGSGGKSLASSMEVYVFPKEGQQAEQQSKDEYSCYEWATSNTGSDPFELNKQSVAQAEETEKAVAAAEQSGKGAGVKGAVRGAAAGAIVGEIANDDASDGAEIGAAAGAISARRKARKAKQQAKAEAEKKGEARQQATEEQLGNFKKAFSVCLEAKDYLVKY